MPFHFPLQLHIHVYKLRRFSLRFSIPSAHSGIKFGIIFGIILHFINNEGPSAVLTPLMIATIQYLAGLEMATATSWPSTILSVPFKAQSV